MIIILSHDDDRHAQVVLQQVASQGGKATLFDVAHFPTKARLTAQYGCTGNATNLQLRTTTRHIDFDDVSAIWWRRPRAPQVDAAVAELEHRQFALSECTEAIEGLWQCVDAFWVNDPIRDRVAHRKLLQLKLAQQLGMTVPTTCVTNDAAEAQRFVTSVRPGRVAYKAFAATQALWRETRIVGAVELEALNAVQFAPVIFQEYIEAECDIRVTVVGRTIFAAAIHVGESQYPVDYRMSLGQAKIEAVTLPTSLQDSIHALMDRLALSYGALDFRRLANGQHVFLEINPAGQWLFVEQATHQPISTAVASLLMGAR